MVILSPLSAVLNWIYGILLVQVFAAALHILPFGGINDPHSSQNRLDALASLLRRLHLPITSILLTKFIKNVYA